jgi:hypothetical protein
VRVNKNRIVLANRLMHQIHKNSSTIILPQRYRILESLSLEARMIPCDICTHWNATYDMLDFAYQYKKAINKITDIRDMKLRRYEIEVHKWEIVQQLRDLLKVSKYCFWFLCRFFTIF